MEIAIGVIIIVVIAASIAGFFYWQYRNMLREAKNYERGLKMVPLLIRLPPASGDIEGGGRDERDVTEETISQAQVLYNIVASTSVKGFKSRIYGQRHIVFEIVANKGLVHYYTVVPVALVDVVRQAIAAAYPAARLDEVEEHNLFSPVGKVSGTIGGELTLKKHYSYPISTYQDSKRDAMRAILNALSTAGREDGIGIQILMRPAPEGWAKNVLSTASKIRKEKGKKNGVKDSLAPGGLLEALWKAPEVKEVKPEDSQLSSLEQSQIDAIEEKTRHPGYEVLIRVVASSNTAARSQVLLKNVVAAFALFDSPGNNGFKFTLTKNVEQFVTAFIFRFFPQEINSNVLNSVELATIFHLPDQKNIPTSQVERQASKQVDGPNQLLDEGFLMGYNVYRGVKKEIRLSTNDRRRHTYIIGQTGTGKSKLLENLALQDMLDGKGFAFIDPHGDSAEELLGMVPKERVEDVVYFDPGNMDNPIGMNLFEISKDDPDPQRTMDYIISELVNMLYSMYDPGRTGIVGPRMENIVRNAAILIMSDPAGGTFMDIPKLLVDPDFANSKIKHLKNQRAIDFWTKEWPGAQRSNEAGEVTSWVVSKWAPFENSMTTNILGQLESGLNLRDIMDNKKILLVNLSKGRLGELSAKLLGTVFVMKFQAAAMARADMPEDQRVDFALYVDEFQNFATDSFESILSEARKYRLNLILANQFVSQLTDKIREAIIGNVGTIISSRIGTTDAELMAKKFMPVFDAEDLTKLPNYEGAVVAQIHGMPSSPFSMSFLPPLGKANPQLAGALKRLSAAKFGKPRADVEREMFARLRPVDTAKAAEQKAVPDKHAKSAAKSGEQPGSSFLDEWLAKRKTLQQEPKTPAASPAPQPTAASVKPVKQISAQPSKSAPSTTTKSAPVTGSPAVLTVPRKTNDSVTEGAFQQLLATEPADVEVVTASKRGDYDETTLQINLPDMPEDESAGATAIKPAIDEIYIDLRGSLHHRESEDDQALEASDPKQH